MAWFYVLCLLQHVTIKGLNVSCVHSNSASVGLFSMCELQRNSWL